MRAVLLLLMMALAVSAVSGQGRRSGRQAERRREVSEQLETVKVRLVNISSQYQELEKQKNENVEQSAALQQELASINARQARAAESLNRIREELRQAEAAHAEHLDRFTKGLAHFYKLKNRPYLAFILGAKDMAEFSRRYKYLQYIFQQDYLELETLQRTRKELVAKQMAVEAATRDLESTKSQKELKSQELIATIHKGQDILESLKKERQKALERARQLQAAMEYIGAKVDQVSRTPSPEAGTFIPPAATSEQPAPTNINNRNARPGRIAWPIDASQEIQIVRAYGQSKGEAGSLYFNPGIDIRVPQPQQVRAVEAGRVMYRGDMPNFGKVVFIDHGGNPDKIISIYGNLDDILVPVGQDVARGQAVGTVGRTDDERDATLHFEIRQNAAHQDPLKWLQRVAGRTGG